jgi:two-component system, sensor histidine kinase LadS
MPSVLVCIFLAFFCLCTDWGRAEAASADNTNTITVKTWIDEGSYASIDAVSDGAAQSLLFTAGPTGGYFPIKQHDSLWIQVNLTAIRYGQGRWTLNIPIPSLDSVTLYQRNAQGGWDTQLAGDAYAQSQWYRPGLYADFDLNPGTSEVFLQLRNFKPTAVPLRITQSSTRETQRKWELFGITLLMGIFLCSMVFASLRWTWHHAVMDGWATFSGLGFLVMAQISGVGNALFWAEYPIFGNYASNLFPIVGVACVTLLVRKILLLSVSLYWDWVPSALSLAGWGSLVTALTFALFPRYVANEISSIFVFSASLLTLLTAVFVGYKGFAPGRWLAIIMLPQLLWQFYVMGEGLEVFPFLQNMQVASALALAISIPALLYVFSQFHHERETLVARVNHFPTHDALTGLLTADVFQTHLDIAISESIESRHPAALARVRLINHDYILITLGHVVAEQALLRAAVKLQCLLRNSDPIARVGVSDFAFLLDGVSDRESVRRRMKKFMGSGLIPLPDISPEINLRFHIVCVMLNEKQVPANRVIRDLGQRLNGMNPTTRRPLRFL